MTKTHRRRVVVTMFLLLLLSTGYASWHDVLPGLSITSNTSTQSQAAIAMLNKLDVKGRAPKTGYEREKFGDGWSMSEGCDTRNRILARDLTLEQVGDECKILNGTLVDPYTNKTIHFQRGATTSDDVQIDHVVALSNAWQTGAQQMSIRKREAFANDPLELLAVSGEANQEKSDGDAATWLPKNKSFRCQYVIRQIKVKLKYNLWLTPPEKDAMQRVLQAC